MGNDKKSLRSTYSNEKAEETNHTLPITQEIQTGSMNNNWESERNNNSPNNSIVENNNNFNGNSRNFTGQSRVVPMIPMSFSQGQYDRHFPPQGTQFTTWNGQYRKQRPAYQGQRHFNG